MKITQKEKRTLLSLRHMKVVKDFLQPPRYELADQFKQNIINWLQELHIQYNVQIKKKRCGLFF